MLFLATSLYPCAADSVDITLPSAVSFNVTDVNQNSASIPNPTPFSYSNFTGSYITISIIANAPNFTRPVEDGGFIPASKVFCRADQGVFDGDYLSSTYYIYVFMYDEPGDYNFFFTLDPPGTAVRGGAHTLTATWKVESF